MGEKKVKGDKEMNENYKTKIKSRKRDENCPEMKVKSEKESQKFKKGEKKTKR